MFGFALNTAILKAGPCTTALAICLKQMCHVTRIKQLWNVYSVNLFLYQPHFGAGTDEPWKNFTHCYRNSCPKSWNWPRSQMCRRPRNKEELIPLFPFLFLFGVKHENAPWISKTITTGWLYRISQTRQIGPKTFFCWRRVTTQAHTAKITHFWDQGKPRPISSMKENNHLLFPGHLISRKADRTNESFCSFITPPTSHKQTMTWDLSAFHSKKNVQEDQNSCA